MLAWICEKMLITWQSNKTKHANINLVKMVVAKNELDRVSLFLKLIP